MTSHPATRSPTCACPRPPGEELSLSEIAGEQPLVLAFLRGWWCPKEQVRARNLVALQDEIQREYGKIAVVTVDEPYVNGAFRAGLGAAFPFLSDEDRRVAEELDLLELTDETHRPYLPVHVRPRLPAPDPRGSGAASGTGATRPPRSFVRRSGEITRAEQPTFDPQAVWQAGGAARSRRRHRRRRRLDPRELEGTGALARRPPRASSPTWATRSAARWWTAAPGSCARSSARTAASAST